MAVDENDLVVGPIVPALGVSLISLDFFFEDEDDIEVYKSGSETPLTLTADYTVAGEGTATGSVTLVVAADGIDAYSVYLRLPLARSTDLQLRGQFRSDPFNTEMDRLWQAMQGVRATINRALQITRTSETVAPVIVAAEGFLKFDENGDLETVAAITDTPVSPFMVTVLDDLDADEAKATLEIDIIYTTVALLLASTEASRGTGVIWEAQGFRYEEVASGGDIQNSAGTPVQLKVLPDSSNFMNFVAFGAVGDGVTDNTATIQACLNAGAGVAKVTGGDGVFMISAETDQPLPFPFTGGIVIPSNTHMILGSETTIGTLTNNFKKGITCSVYQVDNVTIEGGNWEGDWATHAFENLFETLAKMNVNDYRTRTINTGDNIFVNGDVGYIYQDGGNNGEYLYDGATWNFVTSTLPDYITHEFHAAVDIRESTNVKLLNMRISDFIGDGIFIAGVSSGDPAGTHDASPKNILISGCTIEASRRNGIAVVGGDDVTMIGNHINDTGIRKYNQDGTAPRTGIDIEVGGFLKSDRIIIADNTFRGNVSGAINTFDGNNISVTGNVADSAIAFGFGVNVTISGNVLSAAPDTGFQKPLIAGNDTRVPIAGTWVQSGTTITVTAASAHQHGAGGEVWFEDDDTASGLSGLYTVTSAADTVTLTFEVDTSDTTSGSCEIKYQTNNVVISGNTLRGGGISATGEHILVSGNIIDMPKGDSVALTIFNAKDVMVCGNKVRTNTFAGGSAVRLFQTDNVTLQDNVIEGGGQHCVLLTLAAGDTAHILNNVFRGFNGYGLEIAGSSDSEAFVFGNTFKSLPTAVLASIWHRVGRAHIINNTVLDAQREGFINAAGAISIVKGNSFLRGVNFTSISIGADDTQFINNIVTKGKLSNGWYGIHTTTTNGSLIAGNILYNETAFTATKCINTDTGTNARVLNNIADDVGALLNDATDTVAGNQIS